MNIDHKPVHVTITTNTILRIILLLCLGFLLFKIKDLLFILLVSIVVATFVDTIADKLKEYKIPRTLSVVVVFILLIVGLGALVYAVVPTLFGELSKALTNLSKYVPQDKLQAIIDPNLIKNINLFVNNIGTQMPVSQVATSTKALLTSFSGAFYGTVQTLFGSLANLVLMFVFSFYLSVQEGGIESFLKLIMPIKYETYIIGLWRRSSRKISLWIRGQMMMALLAALVTFAVLSILHVPYALILSLLTLVCELIPFGMMFATVPAVLVGFSTGGVQLGLIILLFYFLYQQLEGYVILPLMNRKMTGISPLMVILALLIGAKLAGFWGLILAMPVAIFILEIMNDVETKKDSIRKLTENN